MTLIPIFQRTTGRAIVTPDDPDTVPDAPRRLNAKGQRSRRPHSDDKVAEIRRLIETTTLTYGQISARTGVAPASISRWARDMAWTRPFDAPRATDRMPRYRLSQKLKLRQLAEKLRRLAERHISELEKAPVVDPDKLMQALEILKMTRLHIQGRRRDRFRKDVTRTGRQWMDEQEAIRTAIREMHRGGVNVDRAPQEAVELYLAAHTPPDHPALRPRGRRRRV